MQIEQPTPLQVSERLALFPDSTRLEGGALTIAGHELAALAEEFGTPLYLYDGKTMDASVERYAAALRFYEGPDAALTYAGKAYLCRAIAEWVEDRGMWLDCTGETEIQMARAGKVKRERIVVHGVNKSPQDLQAAVDQAGTIVVDNLYELERLIPFAGRLPELWLRLLPGTAVQTHHVHTQTGQHGSKFGMTSQEIAEAVRLCKERSLPLEGLHFHQGSNFRDPAPLLAAIEAALDLVKEMGFGEAWHFCPGGGWSVAYHEDDLPDPSIEMYVRFITSNLLEGCRKRGLALPHLHLEPGRSLVARAGVAVYRAGTVKETSGQRWVLVDAQLDELQCDTMKIPFDTLDVPRDQFIVGNVGIRLATHIKDGRQQ